MPFILAKMTMKHPEQGLPEAVLAQYLGQHTCRVCPRTQICTQGPILSSFLKCGRQLLITSAQELPEANTHRY